MEATTDPFTEWQEVDLPALPPLSDEAAHSLIDDLCSHQERIARIKAGAEAMIRLEQQEIDRLLFRDGQRLEEWARARLAELTAGSKRRRRSFPTLFGTVGFRTQAARLSVADDTAALVWCQEHRPQAVTLKVDVGAVGKPADFHEPDPLTGELGFAPPPGFTVTPEAERFYVKSAAKEEGGDE